MPEQEGMNDSPVVDFGRAASIIEGSVPSGPQQPVADPTQPAVEPYSKDPYINQLHKERLAREEQERQEYVDWYAARGIDYDQRAAQHGREWHAEYQKKLQQEEKQRIENEYKALPAEQRKWVDRMRYGSEAKSYLQKEQERNKAIENLSERHAANTQAANAYIAQLAKEVELGTPASQENAQRLISISQELGDEYPEVAAAAQQQLSQALNLRGTDESALARGLTYHQMLAEQEEAKQLRKDAGMFGTTLNDAREIKRFRKQVEERKEGFAPAQTIGEAAEKGVLMPVRLMNRVIAAVGNEYTDAIAKRAKQFKTSELIGLDKDSSLAGLINLWSAPFNPAVALANMDSKDAKQIADAAAQVEDQLTKASQLANLEEFGDTWGLLANAAQSATDSSAKALWFAPLGNASLSAAGLSTDAADLTYYNSIEAGESKWDAFQKATGAFASEFVSESVFNAIDMPGIEGAFTKRAITRGAKQGSKNFFKHMGQNFLRTAGEELPSELLSVAIDKGFNQMYPDMEKGSPQELANEILDTAVSTLVSVGSYAPITSVQEFSARKLNDLNSKNMRELVEGEAQRKNFLWANMWATDVQDAAGNDIYLTDRLANLKSPTRKNMEEIFNRFGLAAPRLSKTERENLVRQAQYMKNNAERIAEEHKMTTALEMADASMAQDGIEDTARHIRENPEEHFERVRAALEELEGANFREIDARSTDPLLNKKRTKPASKKSTFQRVKEAAQDLLHVRAVSNQKKNTEQAQEVELAEYISDKEARRQGLQDESDLRMWLFDELGLAESESPDKYFNVIMPHMVRAQRDFAGALPSGALPGYVQKLANRTSKGGVQILKYSISNGGGIGKVRLAAGNADADVKNAFNQLVAALHETLPDNKFEVFRDGWDFYVVRTADKGTVDHHNLETVGNFAQQQYTEYASRTGLDAAPGREGEEDGSKATFVVDSTANNGELFQALSKPYAPARTIDTSKLNAEEILDKEDRGETLTPEEQAYLDLSTEAMLSEEQIAKIAPQIAEFQRSDSMSHMRMGMTFERDLDASMAESEGVYIEADIGNLKGLTDFFIEKTGSQREGRRIADQHLEGISGIINEAVESAGGYAYRKGGDEIGIFIPKGKMADLFSSTSNGKSSLPFDKMARDVVEYEKANGLLAIPHTKTERSSGVGVVFAATPYAKGDTSAEIRGKSEEILERLKKGKKNEYGKSSYELGTGASNRSVGERTTEGAGPGGPQARQKDRTTEKIFGQARSAGAYAARTGREEAEGAGAQSTANQGVPGKTGRAKIGREYARAEAESIGDQYGRANSGQRAERVSEGLGKPADLVNDLAALADPNQPVPAGIIALDTMLQDPAIVPHIKSIQQIDGTSDFMLTMNNGMQVRLRYRSEILSPTGDRGAAGYHVDTLGVTLDISRLARREDIDHEFFHIARLMGLVSEKEFQALRKRYAKGVRDDYRAEELVAEGISKSAVSITNRIKNFFRALYDNLLGSTAGRFTRDWRAGDVWFREQAIGKKISYSNIVSKEQQAINRTLRQIQNTLSRLEDQYRDSDPDKAAMYHAAKYDVKKMVHLAKHDPEVLSDLTVPHAEVPQGSLMYSVQAPEKLNVPLSELPPQDKEYLQALRAGDTETMQSIVDQAAVAAGYDLGKFVRHTKEGYRTMIPTGLDRTASINASDAGPAGIYTTREGDREYSGFGAGRYVMHGRATGEMIYPRTRLTKKMFDVFKKHMGFGDKQKESITKWQNELLKRANDLLLFDTQGTDTPYFIDGKPLRDYVSQDDIFPIQDLIEDIESRGKKVSKANLIAAAERALEDVEEVDEDALSFGDENEAYTKIISALKKGKTFQKVSEKAAADYFKTDEHKNLENLSPEDWFNSQVDQGNLSALDVMYHLWVGQQELVVSGQSKYGDGMLHWHDEEGDGLTYEQKVKRKEDARAALLELGYTVVNKNEMGGASEGLIDFPGKGLPDMDEVIFLNPTDVKSAEPVARTIDGEVIAPSQRFNPDTPDIMYSIPAYHGGAANILAALDPEDRRFLLKYIGTGEGAQAFGWGLYFTDKLGIARTYARDMGVEVETAGSYEEAAEGKRNLYSVNLWGGRNDEKLLLWNSQVPAEQREQIYEQLRKEAELPGPVQRAFNRLYENGVEDFIKEHRENYTDAKGRTLYSDLALVFEADPGKSDHKKPNETDKVYGKRRASMFLRRAGFDGIKFPAASGGRGDGSEGWNYVVFDEDAVEIIEHEIYSLAPEESKRSKMLGAQKRMELLGRMKDVYQKSPATSEKIDTAMKGLDDYMSGRAARRNEAYTFGRPELANPAETPESRELMDAFDEVEGSPRRKRDAEVRAQAEVFKSQNPPEAVHDMLMDRAARLAPMNDVETFLAKEYVAQVTAQAIASKDPQDLKLAAQVANAWRTTGTEAARGMRQRVDVIETPAERLAHAIRNAIFMPKGKRARVQETKEQRKRHKATMQLESAMDQLALYENNRQNIKAQLSDLRTQFNQGKIAPAVYEKRKAELNKNLLWVEDMVTRKQNEIRGIKNRKKRAEERIDTILEGVAEDIDVAQRILEKMGYDIDNDAIEALSQNPVDASNFLNEMHALSSSWHSKMFEYWFSAILSGPATHMRNILGNVSYAATQTAFLRPIEALLNTLVVKNQDSAQLSELWPMYSALFKGANWAQAFRLAMGTFNAEMDMLEHLYGGSDIGGKLYQGRAKIRGKLGKGLRIPLRTLAAADTFCRTITSRMDVAAMAHRETMKRVNEGIIPDNAQAIEGDMLRQMRDTDSDAWSLALHHSAEWAFMKGVEETEGGKAALDAASTIRRGVPALQMFFPFIQIPANILYRGYRHSILGLPAMAWQVKKAFDGEVEWTEATTRMSNPESSVRIPFMEGEDGKPLWLSYKGVEPFATVLQLHVDTIKHLLREDPQVDKFISGTARQIVDKSYLKGVNDLSKLMEGATENQLGSPLMYWSKGLLSSLAPNLIRSPIYEWETQAKNTRIWGDDKFGMWQKRVIQGTGVGTFLYPMEPMVDLWGRDVDKESPSTSLAWRLASPLKLEESADIHPGDRVFMNYIANINSEEEEKEAVSLPDAPRPYVTHNGEKIIMTEPEYTQFMRRSGELASEWTTQYVSGLSEEIIANPPAAVVENIKSLITRGRSVAKNELIRKRGDL